MPTEIPAEIKDLIANWDSLSETRQKRLSNGFLTLMNLNGIDSPRQGFYAPHRYAHHINRPLPDEYVSWLKDYLETREKPFRNIVQQISSFNPRLAQFAAKEDIPDGRPRYDQEWFSGYDGTMAYGMVRLLEPETVLEIGSGHSTRFMARGIKDQGAGTRLVSIDPQPRKEIDHLCDDIHRHVVQKADPALFGSLKENDILFIDGSHLAHPGTDADLFLGWIFPQLAPGVVIHIHDIFLPFGYPDEDTWRWWNYNEQHGVLYMLGGGNRYEVLWASHFVKRCHPEWAELMIAPNPKGAKECSLWLKVHK